MHGMQSCLFTSHAPLTLPVQTQLPLLAQKNPTPNRPPKCLSVCSLCGGLFCRACVRDRSYAIKTSGSQAMLPTCTLCLHLQSRLEILDALYQAHENPPNVVVLYAHVVAQKAGIEMSLVEWTTVLSRRQQHALKEGAFVGCCFCGVFFLTCIPNAPGEKWQSCTISSCSNSRPHLYCRQLPRLHFAMSLDTVTRFKILHCTHWLAVHASFNTGG
jgi:hypothetical protein